MLHRLSFEKGVDLAKAIRDNRAYLDKRFPLWRNNPYMRLSYVLSHRMVNLKLMIVKTLYGLHLFRAFLFVYGSMIKYLGIDIKW